MKQLFTIVTLLSLIVGCKQPIDLEEITAENINQLYKDSYDGLPLSDFQMTSFSPYQQFFNSPENPRPNDPNIKWDIQNHSNGINRKVELLDRASNTYFTFAFVKDNVYSVNLLNMSQDIPDANEMIDYLIRDQQFVYKKAYDVRVHDVLLKKLDDKHLLTVTIIKNEGGGVGSISFHIKQRK